MHFDAGRFQNCAVVRASALCRQRGFLLHESKCPASRSFGIFPLTSFSFLLHESKYPASSAPSGRAAYTLGNALRIAVFSQDFITRFAARDYLSRHSPCSYLARGLP